MKSGALDSLGKSRATLLLEARLLARTRAYQAARFIAEGTVDRHHGVATLTVERMKGVRSAGADGELP